VLLGHRLGIMWEAVKTDTGKESVSVTERMKWKVSKQALAALVSSLSTSLKFKLEK
jgi:hypothetical protein